MDRMDRLSDDDDDEPSSGSEAYEEGDLLSAAMDDDVTAQLAAAGWQIKHVNGDFSLFFAFLLIISPDRSSPVCLRLCNIFSHKVQLCALTVAAVSAPQPNPWFDFFALLHAVCVFFLLLFFFCLLILITFVLTILFLVRNVCPTLCP